MAILGHDDITHAELYTREAEQAPCSRRHGEIDHDAPQAGLANRVANHTSTLPNTLMISMTVTLHKESTHRSKTCRSTIRLRFCGLARLAIVESMWSLTRTDRCVRRTAIALSRFRHEIVGSWRSGSGIGRQCGLKVSMLHQIRAFSALRTLHYCMRGNRVIVSDRLSVAVDQGHIDRKIDTGAGHHLSLERVAMQVDDSRQHQQAAASYRAIRAHGRFHGVDFCRPAICTEVSRISPPSRAGRLR